MNVYMNHGRWIVDCSADDCRSVGYAQETPGGFYSPVCQCNDVTICDHPQLPCGVPIEVMFPADKLMVDWLMSRRPRKANRNWTAETVAELKRENLLHGVGI